MTQVTDEMIEAALDAYDAPRYAPCEKRMRTALEAALAARQSPPPPDMRDAAADLRDLGQQLEECGVAHRCWSQAAPYVVVLRDFLAAQAGLHEKDAIIERQAEEIARITAERAELIEALRPFANEASEWSNIDAKDDDLVMIKSKGDDDCDIAHFTVGDLYRARALLERIAKP